MSMATRQVCECGNAQCADRPREWRCTVGLRSAFATQDAEIARLRATLESVRPFVSMAKSTTSGRDFHDNVDALLKKIDASLATQGGRVNRHGDRIVAEISGEHAGQTWAVCNHCGATYPPESTCMNDAFHPGGPAYTTR